MRITPYSQHTDFGLPLTLDDKITIFEEQMLGWVLDIADASINGAPAFNGTQLGGPILHSGYAVLQIVFVYFELIARVKPGSDAGTDSRLLFERGVLDVYGGLWDEDEQRDGMQILYDSARRGLYEAGRTQGRIILSGRPGEALQYDGDTRQMVINPHRLVPDLKDHFRRYIEALRDPTNRPLRDGFQAAFDSLNASDPLVQRGYPVCFIAYAKEDKAFCDRLFDGLTANGVEVWYFPESAKWDRPVWGPEGEIDLGILRADKSVVICSRHSLQSEAVLNEIDLALKREEQEGKHVLFPVRLDDYIFEEWEHPRKEEVLGHVVGDFRGWDLDVTRYRTQFERLLRALGKESNFGPS